MATPVSDYEAWLNGLTVEAIGRALSDLGCPEVLVRRLSAKQGNSKQQVYLGTDLTQVARIPSGDLETHEGSSNKPGWRGKPIFRASVPLEWLAPGFSTVPAPGTKIIFYPQYPEVRLSGFLRGCVDPPAWLLSIDKRGKDPNRLLLLAPTPDGRLIGLCLPPEAPSAGGIWDRATDEHGPFRLWSLEEPEQDSRGELLRQLRGVADLGWIPATRLTSVGPRPCRGTNCGGYTLEASLGVVANGRAEPDFLGWELKAHKVTSLARVGRVGALTLMTPEPDGGPYRQLSTLEFLVANGYPNDPALPTRWDFTGSHRVGRAPMPRTGTTLVLDGYRSRTDYDASGCIALIGREGEPIATWSFAKILDHWRRKHAMTAYVPYVSRKLEGVQYSYGTSIWLGEGTGFPSLLESIASGAVYYDPGIRSKRMGEVWDSKRRNQFRVHARDLDCLYDQFTEVDAQTVDRDRSASASSREN